MTRLNPLRHQLASTSPVRLRGLFAAATAASGGADPREKLCELVREEHGVGHVVLCGSGTEALALALRAAERLSPPEGATVVLPAFSCFDVAAAAVHFGRPIRFYDIDPITLGPDPASLQAALTGEPATVVIASLFGIPIDWDTLDPIVEAAGAFVVEDAAQGHGGRWRGQPLGGHGRLGILSFGRGKGWTGGSGGALLIRDEADAAALAVLPLAAPAKRLEIVLKAAAHWALGRPALYGLPRVVPGLGLGETHYHELHALRAMAPSAAALALDGKAMADRAVEGRRAAAERYRGRLAELGIGPEIRGPTAAQPGYGRFPALLPRGMDSFQKPSEARRLGAARGYPTPLPFLAATLPLQTDATADRRTWPGAQTLVERLVTLPTHPLTKPGERDRLVALIATD